VLPTVLPPGIAFTLTVFQLLTPLLCRSKLKLPRMTGTLERFVVGPRGVCGGYEEGRVDRSLLKGCVGMFEKIVVCLDGSELAEQILPYAAEQALHFGSVVVLLRVVPEPVIVTPGIPGVAGTILVTSRMEQRVEKEESESGMYLRAVAERLLAGHRLHAECVTLLGAPGQSIVEYATANEVGLIAIATHGRSGPGRAIFGSVADFVLRQSRLPILLVRPITAKPS
jgi:nucleotide-binding universal stress UspA family protein